MAVGKHSKLCHLFTFVIDNISRGHQNNHIGDDDVDGVVGLSKISLLIRFVQ